MSLNNIIDNATAEVYGRKPKKNFENISENTSEKSSQNTSQEPSKNGFHDLGISSNLLADIQRLKFSIPTPIQKQAIPLGITGKDVIAIAQTGSGKTVAFGVPMLQRLAQSKTGVGLVLVPTRELALQVDESLQLLSKSMRMPSVVLIGGAPMFPQLRALKARPRIIIATPGRLMDHIERRTVRLENIEVFVLDEADRMLDMGFIPDIKKVVKLIPQERQTMLFSATMPKEVEAIAKTLMESPTRIEVDPSGATPADVSQELFFIQGADRNRLLAMQVKECVGPVLVFTRTKRMATKLTMKINKMGFGATEIHSNRSLGQRRHALEGFKRGKYQILVATDIAARGIDVPGIQLVVNYDMPANSEDYVHRIGRTGRAGKSGHAISFVGSDQKSSLRSLERFMKTKLKISAVPNLPTEALILKEAELKKLRKPPAKSAKPFSEHKPSRRQAAKTRDENYRTLNESGKNSGKTSSKRPAKKYAGDGSKDSSNKAKYSKRNNTNSQDSKRFQNTDSSESSNYSKGTKSTKNTGSKAYKPKNSNKSNKPSSSSKPSASKSSKKSPTENTFWSNFKKKSSTEKKSVGQGSKRRQRTKRK